MSISGKEEGYLYQWMTGTGIKLYELNWPTTQEVEWIRVTNEAGGYEVERLHERPKGCKQVPVRNCSTLQALLLNLERKQGISTQMVEIAGSIEVKVGLTRNKIHGRKLTAVWLDEIVSIEAAERIIAKPAPTPEHYGTW